MNHRACLLSIVSLAAMACAGEQKFPLREPMWRDYDKRPHPRQPKLYYSGLLWDGADQMGFRPLSRLFAVETKREAINVNAMDEVPSSSWWTHRIGARSFGPEEVARGPCTTPPLDETRGPWLVTRGKPNGATPGFFFKGPDKRHYVFKTDGISAPRGSAADAIGSRLYWLVGYNTPCNTVAYVQKSIFELAPDAKSEDASGNKLAMTVADIDKVLAKAEVTSDGRYRGSVSLFLEGEVLGPFRYEGTRDDDPNDVVPHEHRRELRGSQVIGGWLNHTDAREQNTMDTWIKVGNSGGYVRHHLLDFSDCLGTIWEPPMMGRRIGHTSFFDAGDVFADFVSLGLIRRSWDEQRFGVTGKVLGYYDVAYYEPDAWQPQYNVPAMLERTERDMAWMARLIARVTPEHVRAIVATARIQQQPIEEELLRVMLGRRKKLLARFLSRLSPLVRPTVEVGSGRATLCLDDLGLSSGTFPKATRRHSARGWAGDDLAPFPAALSAVGPRVCVELPVFQGASARSPYYLVIDVVATSGSQDPNPARVHLYHLGGLDYRVVGLERPESNNPP